MHFAQYEEDFGREWAENWLKEWEESMKNEMREHNILPMQTKLSSSILFDGWNQ